MNATERGLMGRIVRIFPVAVLLDDAQRLDIAPNVPWLAAAAELLVKRYAERDYDAAADRSYAALIARIAG